MIIPNSPFLIPAIPRYAEVEGALPGQFRHLHTDIYGNREFVEHLRNPPSPKGFGGTGRGKFFDHEEKRERDLVLNMRNSERKSA